MKGEIKTGVLSRLDLDTKEIEDYLIRFEPNNKLGIGEENCDHMKISILMVSMYIKIL